MATVTTVPLEVYLHSTYEPDAEYVDGVIEERPTGELDHAAWQAALIMYFRQHPNWNIKVYPELRVRLSPTRYRVPDVTVIDRAAPREQIISHPPVAVFEILSPEDTMSRVLKKLGDYETMGIPGIFVIDPTNQHYYVFHQGGLDSVAGPVEIGPCHIDFEEIAKLLS